MAVFTLGTVSIDEIPMAKADIENADAAYHQRVVQANLSLRAGLIMEAIEIAKSSWPYIDGMVQYQRKYQMNESFGLDGIEIVLRLSPLLFDFSSLDDLDVLLKAQRRIGKSSSRDLNDAIRESRILMSTARQLWDLLERQGELDLNKATGNERAQIQQIVVFWESVGLIRQIASGSSFRLSLATQMDLAVLAKCPSCGATIRAPKIRFLTEIECPKCHVKGYCVLLNGNSIEN